MAPAEWRRRLATQGVTGLGQMGIGRRSEVPIHQTASRNRFHILLAKPLVSSPAAGKQIPGVDQCPYSQNSRNPFPAS